MNGESGKNMNCTQPSSVQIKANINLHIIQNECAAYLVKCEMVHKRETERTSERERERVRNGVRKG